MSDSKLTFFARTSMIKLSDNSSGVCIRCGELYMIDGYTTVKIIAENWGITARTVQIMCAEGKIKGATKFGNVWAIPVNAEKPTDNRVVSGDYKNWRKRKNNEVK